MFRPMMTIKELVDEWGYATLGEKCLIGLHVLLNLFIYALIIFFFAKIFF